jgi:hypothetical protein
MEKEILLNEQQIEFIKYSMEVILDEEDWSATSRSIAQSIINKLTEENENI